MSASHDDCVPLSGYPEGETWHQIGNSEDLVKWQYKDGPYRVCVVLDDRGHWRAIFTTWYNPTSYLIRGGCGGGELGRMKAIASAEAWMDANKYGCPPPGEMK